MAEARNDQGEGPGPQARIDDLEARIAFQEQAIEDLSREVFRQQQALERLDGRLRRLAEQAERIAERLTVDGPPEPPPPHY